MQSNYGPQDTNFDQTQAWFSFPDDMGVQFDGDIIPWVDDMFEGHFLDAPEDLQPVEAVNHPSSNLQHEGRFQPGKDTSHVVPKSPMRGDSRSSASSRRQDSLPGPNELATTKDRLDGVPDHLLAQHYTRNLTGRYSSRDSGWNFYMYFYTRFTTSHPFVLSSLYAWTATHLFYSGTLHSLQDAFSHYKKCCSDIRNLFKIDLDRQFTTPIDNSEVFVVAQIHSDDLDAIAVALYFLASTDLIMSRSEELGQVLRMVTLLLQTKHQEISNSLFTKVSTWLCFLDARYSAFGAGNSSVINAMGGEVGIVRAAHVTRDLLEREYKVLYPTEERQRDEYRFPLLEIILRLVAVFGEISREYVARDGIVRAGVRASLNSIEKVGFTLKLSKQSLTITRL